MKREQMIKDLTKFELEYFSDNFELLGELTVFFSNGGFNSYTDEALVLAWEDKFID